MAKRGRKPKHQLNVEANKSILKSVFSLFLLFLGVLAIISIFVSLTGSAGAVNSKMKTVLSDMFGLLGIFVGVLLIYGSIISMGILKSKLIRRRIFIGLLLMFVSLLGLFGSGGGTVGGLVRDTTASLVSVPGAVFLYFILLILAIILITNTGLHAFFEKINHGFDFVKVKILRIDLPDDDEEEEENESGEDASDGEETQDDENVVDGEMEDSSQQMLESSTVDNDDASFQILHPPSGPVGEESSYELVNGPDEEVVELETSQPKVHEDKTSLSRLPYTNKVWDYPGMDLLSDAPNREGDAGDTASRAKTIEDTLKAFGIKAKLFNVHVGPAFTRYSLEWPEGTKTSKALNLAPDLALRLKSPSGSVRVEAPIPGTNLVGIEVPNNTPSSVTFRSVMDSEEMKKAKNKLVVPIGHDVSGRTLVQDIGRWPHCLIAGSTGSGKSVMLNSIIATLLFRCSPAECRFIMVDPKLVELSMYNGIPHLLTPVVTDIEQKAVSAFAWAVAEMERRYKLFANAAVRNLDDYNRISGFQAEPYIIIVVDELADMMMVAASEVEKYITRLAQKSRATGIHLILATQRPSVNILTGTIKANIPTRIAFKVTSNVDSRVIIDGIGAETLIGRGDMLYVPPDDSKPRRIQGAYIADQEIKNLVEFIKKNGVEPDYKGEITEQKVQVHGSGKSSEGLDETMMQALEIAVRDGKASTSYFQRKLSIGYSKAAGLVDDLEEAGIVGPAKGSKPRDVLVANMDEALERLAENRDENSTR